MSEKNNYLGIDTSNYTTSAALLSSSNVMESKKKLLPVPKGSLGLRQNDAVFLHVKQLPEILDKLELKELSAIGVSDRPRTAEGSYMPCFTVGEAFAQTVSHSISAPLYRFSHQQGHVAAGIYSSEEYKLLKEPFYAFHVSGGTTELLYIKDINNISVFANTLDINAGQLVDRVGVMLDLDFPCGEKIDSLSLFSTRKFNIKPAVKDGNCCLSGFQNIAEDMKKKGEPSEDIALFTISAISKTIEEMVETALAEHALPVLFVGGVMSNSLMKKNFSEKFNSFYAASYSSDNAAGIAYLAKLKHEKII